MRLINVHRNYTGVRSKEQWILAGNYSEDDPRLFGLADYLVANGHATVLQADGVVETGSVAPLSDAAPEVLQADYELADAQPTDEQKQALVEALDEITAYQAAKSEVTEPAPGSPAAVAADFNAANPDSDVVLDQDARPQSRRKLGRG
jgi:hypothetical protein